MIRKATIDDAPDIVAVNIKSWQQAYTRLIPVDILSNLSGKDRLQRWQAGFKDNRFHCFLEERDSRIIGYSCHGKYRDENISPACGEINSIYLLKEYWGSGIGSSLLSGSLSHLKSLHFEKCFIWVLENNDRAIKFYQHHEFQFDGETKLRKIEGFKLVEQRMVRNI